LNLPVVTGLADVSATLLGAGADRPGIAVSIAGTSLLNCLTSDRPQFHPAGVGVSFLLPGGLHARAMPNQTGALAVNWFAREFLGESDPVKLDAMVRHSPAGARGIVFHPYLNSTGVLAPIYEPRARGRFWGLGIAHNRNDLLRAVYEGVALSMADCFSVLPGVTPPVRLVGGLANSPMWRQLFADVTGMPMASLSCSESGALGVAMLAGLAAGVWRDMPEAVSVCCRLADQTTPDTARHEYYRRRLRLYRGLRGKLTEECDLAQEMD
jgi:sugar (pentulose or hexulose) kinase